jgi:hypothetical protein
MRPKRSDSLTARSSRCFTPNSGSFRTVWLGFALRFLGCRYRAPFTGSLREARRHSGTSGLDQQQLRIVIERLAARRPILQCISRPSLNFDCAESSQLASCACFSCPTTRRESRSGIREMPVARSSPIRARPRTSCAFPSQRRIVALNSARVCAGCTMSPMRARPRQPSGPTRLLFRVIAADIRLLAMPPADKETTGNLLPAQHLSFGVIIPYLNVCYTRRRTC